MNAEIASEDQKSRCLPAPKLGLKSHHQQKETGSDQLLLATLRNLVSQSKENHVLTLPGTLKLGRCLCSELSYSLSFHFYRPKSVFVYYRSRTRNSKTFDDPLAIKYLFQTDNLPYLWAFLNARWNFFKIVLYFQALNLVLDYNLTNSLI